MEKFQENDIEQLNLTISNEHGAFSTLSEELSLLNKEIESQKEKFLASQGKFQSTLERMAIINANKESLQDTLTNHQNEQQELISKYVRVLQKLQLMVILKQRHLNHYIEKQQTLQKRIVRSHNELQKEMELFSREVSDHKDRIARKRF